MRFTGQNDYCALFGPGEGNIKYSRRFSEGLFILPVRQVVIISIKENHLVCFSTLRLMKVHHLQRMCVDKFVRYKKRSAISLCKVSQFRRQFADVGLSPREPAS